MMCSCRREKGARRGARGGVRFAVRFGVTLVCVLVVCSAGVSARTPGEPRNLSRVEERVEWARLVGTWQKMIEWSQRVVAPAGKMDELGKEVEVARADLRQLGEDKVISEELAENLGALVESRYEYVRRRLDMSRGPVQLSALEAAKGAAEWIVEMQLAVLRRAKEGSEEDARVAEAAKSNLALELTFLHHYRELEEEVERRRSELTKKEKEGETVDWQRFGNECERRRNALLKAYEERRLSSVRAVRAMVPYVLALTEAQVGESAGSGASRARGM